VLTQQEAALRPVWGKDIRLEIGLAEGLSPICIGPEPLDLLLRHLLSNAREALSDRGQIRVGAKATQVTQADCLEVLGNPSPGFFIEIAITDDGPGFSPEARQRVLSDLFFTTKSRHKGLGLAVVYGIVQAHQGGLRIDASLEPGARVTVYLPAAPAA